MVSHDSMVAWANADTDGQRIDHYKHARLHYARHEGTGALIMRQAHLDVSTTLRVATPESHSGTASETMYLAHAAHDMPDSHPEGTLRPPVQRVSGTVTLRRVSYADSAQQQHHRRRQLQLHKEVAVVANGVSSDGGSAATVRMVDAASGRTRTMVATSLHARFTDDMTTHKPSGAARHDPKRVPGDLDEQPPDSDSDGEYSYDDSEGEKGPSLEALLRCLDKPVVPAQGHANDDTHNGGSPSRTAQCVVALRQLIAQDPEELAAVVTLLTVSGASVGRPQFVALVGALAATASPEAQLGLAALLDAITSNMQRVLSDATSDDGELDSWSMDQLAHDAAMLSDAVRPLVLVGKRLHGGLWAATLRVWHLLEPLQEGSRVMSVPAMGQARDEVRLCQRLLSDCEGVLLLTNACMTATHRP